LAGAGASAASAAEAPVVAAQAEDGNLRGQMPEKELTELVARLRSASLNDLVSVVLFGSAASADFHSDFSDINVLCVFNDLSVPVLASLSATTKWWVRQGHPVPLLFTRDELQKSAKVFTIEFLDIQRDHRVLFGDDVVSKLELSMNLHLQQLQHEFRTKLLLLRERFVVGHGDRTKLLDLLMESLSTFLTLFRHALIATGQPAPRAKREIVDRSATALGLDKSVFEQLLDIREGKLNKKSINVESAFAQYFSAIEHAMARADAIASSPTSSDRHQA
jgi:hypothetical protein